MDGLLILARNASEKRLPIVLSPRPSVPSLVLVHAVLSTAQFSQVGHEDESECNTQMDVHAQRVSENFFF
jgi:hypothetical protein